MDNIIVTFTSVPMKASNNVLLFIIDRKYMYWYIHVGYIQIRQIIIKCLYMYMHND